MKIRLPLCLISGLSVFMLGCSSSPPTAPNPTGIDNLRVFAELDRKDGRWVVGNYCTFAAGRSSLRPCKDKEMTGHEVLYFDVATLKPYQEENILGCVDYSLVDKHEKRIKRCKDFESIYDASLNPVGALGTAVVFVTTFGTTMMRRWVLDEDRFREAIEMALPAPARQAYLLQERDARQGVTKARQDYAAAAPAREAAAQAAQQEETRRREQVRRQYEADRVRYAQDAQSRFAALSVQPKQIGMTICSANNRVGYVEQVAGNRIKVLVKGQAVATWNETSSVFKRNPLGPFEVDTSSLPYGVIGEGSNVDLPVTDPHYLFKAHQTIRIGAIGAGQIWDESRYWGACDWRF